MYFSSFWLFLAIIIVVAIVCNAVVKIIYLSNPAIPARCPVADQPQKGSRI